MLKPLRLAVFGTLRKDEGNYMWALHDAREVALDDVVKGWAMRAFSGYPTVYAAAPDSEVRVDVFDLEDLPDAEERMSRIDSMEFGAGYKRTLVRTEGGHSAWLYYMEADRAMSFPDPVPSGDWFTYLRSEFHNWRKAQ